MCLDVKWGLNRREYWCKYQYNTQDICSEYRQAICIINVQPEETSDRIFREKKMNWENMLAESVLRRVVAMVDIRDEISDVSIL